MNEKTKKIKVLLTFFLVTLLLFALTACNTGEQQVAGKADSKETGKAKNEKAASEEKQGTEVATTVEEILKEQPGNYSENKYNQAIIHKELDEKNFQEKDSFQVYNSLLMLMREGKNYEEQYTFLEDFNPKIETALTDMPGGITLSDDGELGLTANIAILLDASGSMAQKVGGKSKMELAKKAIDDFVASMPEGSNVMLRVYGHKGSNSDSDKKLSCGRTEVVYDLAPYDSADFKASLGKFKPTGWTPIAKAISETKKDFEKAGNDGQNIIYVVSDGIETCDANPVKAARELHDSNIKAVVNIIGFDVDTKGQTQLRSVAEAGGGTFETVNTAEDFNQIWKEERQRLWNEWWDWGNENWNNVWDEQSRKSNSLYDTKNAFFNKVYDEKNRLTEAAYYLQQKEQITYETREEVDSLINQRYEILNTYLEDKFENLKTTLETEGDSLKESIKKKEEEMKEKYQD
ncbi:VWA domain-containing protein [Peribacillus glennii]|uniref:VWA domain-containing protein n=1 Tax=Peribacillus glennii TaxID=2303991 RepID=A0A372LBB3_9BACI|nr:VWA domain-containing protein [Peribacillus glennii]RFU63106.1 VWA domain-containing protein [Peribacillus glennii]